MRQTLLVGLVILACGLNGCGPTTNATHQTNSSDNQPSDSTPVAQTEGEGVKFVESLGGSVKRKDDKPEGPVVEVDLDLKNLTDSGLKNLAAIKSLTRLHRVNTKITDSGLKTVATFTNLTYLDITKTQVTDAGLKELKTLKALTTLGAGLNDLSDAGMKDVAALTTLEFLDLNNTKITDAGLKELQGLKSLKRIDVGQTKVTDDGAKAFKAALPDCLVRR